MSIPFGIPTNTPNLPPGESEMVAKAHPMSEQNEGRVSEMQIMRVIRQLRSVAHERVRNEMDQNAEDRVEWEAADLLQALRASSRGEPVDGWVMVPREATEAMIEAHFAAHAKAQTVFADVPTIWSAMLDAAPAHNSEEEGE